MDFLLVFMFEILGHHSMTSEADVFTCRLCDLEKFVVLNRFSAMTVQAENLKIGTFMTLDKRIGSSVIHIIQPFFHFERSLAVIA